MTEQIPAWIPDARRLPAHRFGAEVGGCLSRVIWMTSEDDPEDRSALLVAQEANRNGAQPHVVWNPVTGELVQMIPVGSKNRMYAPHLDASDCLCVLVVGKEEKPFTETSSMQGSQLTSYITLLGIPPLWPAGPPYAWSPHVKPTMPGHYAATQISSLHKGPGPIDVSRLPKGD